MVCGEQSMHVSCERIAAGRQELVYVEVRDGPRGDIAAVPLRVPRVLVVRVAERDLVEIVGADGRPRPDSSRLEYEPKCGRLRSLCRWHGVSRMERQRRGCRGQ